MDTQLKVEKKISDVIYIPSKTVEIEPELIVESEVT